MKIVLATHNLDTGGIGTLTRGLAAALPSALASTDHLALAGLCPDGLPNQNVECLDGGRIVRYRFGRHLYEQARLARAARRADLLHLVEPRPVLSSRTPFVLTLHDVFFLDRPDWYPRVTRRFKRAMLTAALAKRPRAVICVSRFTRERLLAHCEPHDDTRLEAVHPGLNRPRNQDLEPVAGRPYFLTVAAIEPRKNHLVLLEAFRLARSRGLELNWKVVGGRGYCSRAITKALSEQPGVDLVGLVSDRERDRLYQGSMFCAFPS